MWVFVLLAAGSVSDCSPCLAGYYCSVPGLSYPTGLCDAGFYCPALEDISTPNPTNYTCWAGHYCEVGSGWPVGCPAGTSQPNEGQSYCDNCPAGFYCSSSLVPDPQSCPPYHYCPEG